MSGGMDIGGKKDMGIMDFLFPTMAMEHLMGEPDSGVTAPAVVESKDLPVISSDDSTSKKKQVTRRSGRRQTLIARENMLGVGNSKKKSVLG